MVAAHLREHGLGVRALVGWARGGEKVQKTQKIKRIAPFRCDVKIVTSGGHSCALRNGVLTVGMIFYSSSSSSRNHHLVMVHRLRSHLQSGG